jgi:hypothetical protein
VRIALATVGTTGGARPSPRLRAGCTSAGTALMTASDPERGRRARDLDRPLAAEDAIGAGIERLETIPSTPPLDRT